MLSPSTLPSLMSDWPRGDVTVPVRVDPSTWKSKVMVCVPIRPCTSAVHLPLKSAASAVTEPSAKTSAASASLRNIEVSSASKAIPSRTRPGNGRRESVSEGRTAEPGSLQPAQKKPAASKARGLMIQDCAGTIEATNPDSAPSTIGPAPIGRKTAGPSGHASAPGLLRFAVIAAHQRIPAHVRQVLQHARAVLKVAKLSPFIVRPADRNLSDPQPALERDKQNLRVESPSFDGLERKYRLRSRARKRFEPALGIGKRQPHHRPRHQVKAPPEELPVKRLADCLPRAFQPTRADRNIGSFGNRVEQPLRLFDRRGKIGIGEDQHLALRLQHPVAHAIPFAAVAGIFHQPHLRRALGKGSHHLGSPVAGAVVDHHDLGIPVFVPYPGNDPLKRGRNAAGLVISRNDNAVGGVWHDCLAPVSAGILKCPENLWSS